MRLISTKWPENLALTNHSKVVAKPLVQGTSISMLFEDPAGQKFVLKITAGTSMALVGNLVAANATLNIEAFEMEVGDRYGDITF